MSARKASDRSTAVTLLSPDAEETVGTTADFLAAVYVLDSIKGFGPQKFKQLREAGVAVADIVANPSRLAMKGKRGDEFRARLSTVTADVRARCRERAVRQIHTAYQLGGAVVTYDSAYYPARVYASNNPVPILYVRGNREILRMNNAVACVGSRAIRSPYTGLHGAFAHSACEERFAVVSGFALGADSIGHRVAREVRGCTICCMPGGLDRPFPPENKELWRDLLGYDGALFVSEFPFGTGASSLTLRKRNKLIAAFAQGVLISQSSEKGGAMNAYRFALEQRKPVATFEPDETPDTSGNRLIAETRREGDAVFPASDGREEHVRWLRQLSSST